jgi:imidazolonepropionase-like amidohydrolase
MIMAGTDANLPLAVPGFSFHDELQSLHDAGMSNREVLRAATSSPARWLGINTGRVATGYQADLILLDKDPLEDIKHSQDIHAVIARGQFFDRSLLNDLLLAVEAANDRSRKVGIESYRATDAEH